METPVSAERTSLGHFPDGKWRFDDAVTDVFGDMLRRSIPNYDCMRNVVFEVGSRCVQKGTYVVDLGCSKGDAIESLVSSFGETMQYIGVDSSKPMVKAAQRRFSQAIYRNLVEIKELDLRQAYPAAPASLTLSILSLQFIPLEHRQRVLRDVYTNTTAGGAFIMVEKVLGESDRVHSLMTTWYENKKHQSGYSWDEIIKKKEALEGVLVPLKPSWNVSMLQDAGFSTVDCIWRCMNFAGWVAIK